MFSRCNHSSFHLLSFIFLQFCIFIVTITVAVWGGDKHCSSKQSKAETLFAKGNPDYFFVLAALISSRNGWMDSLAANRLCFVTLQRPCGQLRPSALMSHWNRVSKTARPMRTNVSRWDPVLLGLVQGRGAAAQKSLGSVWWFLETPDVMAKSMKRWSEMGVQWAKYPFWTWFS